MVFLLQIHKTWSWSSVIGNYKWSTRSNMLTSEPYRSSIYSLQMMQEESGSVSDMFYLVI